MSELRKFIVVGLSATCLLSLWILSNTTSLVSQPRTQQAQDNIDILYQPFPEGRNICTIEGLNKGRWVHQDIGLESHSIDGINSFAGYHCNWDFPHRCYRRTEPYTEFNRSKAM